MVVFAVRCEFAGVRAYYVIDECDRYVISILLCYYSAVKRLIIILIHTEFLVRYYKSMIKHFVRLTVFQLMLHCCG